MIEVHITAQGIVPNIAQPNLFKTDKACCCHNQRVIDVHLAVHAICKVPLQLMPAFGSLYIGHLIIARDIAHTVVCLGGSVGNTHNQTTIDTGNCCSGCAHGIIEHDRYDLLCFLLRCKV